MSVKRCSLQISPKSQVGLINKLPVAAEAHEANVLEIALTENLSKLLTAVQ